MNEAVNMVEIAAQYPRPEHFLLHVSDTHFVGNGRLYGSVDVERHLTDLLGRFEQNHARPEAIVITGDMADTGDPAAYLRLRHLVEPIAVRLGATVIWVMGNHDNRSAVRVCLLDQRPSIGPVDQVHWLGGLRVISLDTTVPGQHHGELSDQQLAWLTRHLSTPAPDGTVLAMHHPPVPSLLDLAVLVELRGQDRLAAVLAGTDVRTILAGHLHHSTSATFAGIGVSVAAASCYNQDLAVSMGEMRSLDGGQAVNLVHVFGHTVLHSVLPVGSFHVLSEVTAAESAAQLEMAGVAMEPRSAAAFSQGAGIAK
jgi:Icc protein